MSYSIRGSNINEIKNVSNILASLNNESVELEKNINLNFWQKTFFDNNIQECRRVLVLPTIKAISPAPLSNFFDFRLEGYVHMKQIVLSIEVEVTHVSGTIQPAGSVFNMPGDPNYSTMAQKDYAWLEILDKVEVSIGNNSLLLSEDPYFRSDLGLKFIASVKPKTRLERNIMSSWGLQYVRDRSWTFWTSDTEKLSTGPTFQPDNNIPSRYNNSGSCGVKSIDPSDTFADHFAGQMVALSTSARKILSIPLYMLVPFFDQDAYLPKGLALRITCTYKPNASRNNSILQNCAIVGYDDNNAVFANLKTTGPQIILLPNIYNYAFNICYNANQLVENSQHTLLKIWKDKPFLYNFLDYEYFSFGLYSFKFCGQLEGDIELLDFRPLEIWLYPSMQFQTKSITVTPFPLFVYNPSTSSSCMSFGPANSLVVKSITIRLNGNIIRQVNLPLDTITRQLLVPNVTADDCLNDINIQNTLDEDQSSSMNTSFMRDNFNAYHFIFTPSNYYKNGVLPKVYYKTKLNIIMTFGVIDSTTGANIAPKLTFFDGYTFGAFKANNALTMNVIMKKSKQMYINSEHNCKEKKYPNF